MLQKSHVPFFSESTQFSNTIAPGSQQIRAQISRHSDTGRLDRVGTVTRPDTGVVIDGRAVGKTMKSSTMATRVMVSSEG